MEVKVISENFESYESGGLPLVVDLWATWCGPCRMMGPVILKLADDCGGKTVADKYDVEEDDDIATQFDAHNIPIILPSKGEELVDKLIGAVSKTMFDEKLKALL